MYGNPKASPTEASERSLRKASGRLHNSNLTSVQSKHRLLWLEPPFPRGTAGVCYSELAKESVSHSYHLSIHEGWILAALLSSKTAKTGHGPLSRAGGHLNSTTPVVSEFASICIHGHPAYYNLQTLGEPTYWPI